MIVYGYAVKCGFEGYVFAAGMACNKSVLALKEGLGDVVYNILVKVGGAGQDSHHGYAVGSSYAVYILANGGLCVERMRSDQVIGDLTVDRYNYDIGVVCKLGYSAVGQSGGCECGINGAVLHSGGSLGEAKVLYVKVVIGEAGRSQNLLSVYFGAGALITNAYLLALKVRNAGDSAGCGSYQLNGFGIQGSYGA